MNEYWQTEDDSSFCFCSDGEWYQTKRTDPPGSQWNFCTVTMDNGLPVDMQENDYDEIDLATMLDTLQWTDEELQSQIKSQLNPIE